MTPRSLVVADVKNTLITIWPASDLSEKSTSKIWAKIDSRCCKASILPSRWFSLLGSSVWRSLVWSSFISCLGSL